MRTTLFRDAVDYELDQAIEKLKTCLRNDTKVPLDVYTTLENFGVHIDKLILELELEINGEEDFYNSDWGC